MIIDSTIDNHWYNYYSEWNGIVIQNKKNYVLTYLYKFSTLQASWLDARNLCRSMCMDLVSIETPEENIMVENIMEKVTIDINW